MTVSHHALVELRAKYAEMLAMRRADEAKGREPTKPGAADERHVRARMNDLAERFPGALRELDELPLDVIEQRIAELDVVLSSKGEAAPWMEAIALFHALTRGVLVAKRWLRGRRQLDASASRQFTLDLEALPFPRDSRAWASQLASVATPPRGRLLDLVFARLAHDMGLPEPSVRLLVFGPGRRSTRE